MRHAPRIPRAQVIALARPDPMLETWRAWAATGVAIALLLLGLLAR